MRSLSVALIFVLALLAIAFVVAAQGAKHPRHIRRGSVKKLHRPIENVTGGEIVPFKYPLFKQCDPRWGNNTIETTTICDVGCLMSSVSMAISGHNILIDGQDSNPGVLNKWLRNNNGYTSGNDLIESVVPQINPQNIIWMGSILSGTGMTIEGIQTMLTNPTNIVIGNVRNGTHFVLITGWDSTVPGRFLVNDPGFPVTYYNYTDFVGYRFFAMNTLN